MSQITLETVQAAYTQLGAMIEELQRSAKSQDHRLIVLLEAEIQLRPGEQYAGTVLDANGSLQHHLVLMADVPTEDLNWQAAMDWAASIGGELPTRQEQALLYANCKPHLQPRWHWSSETHEDDASYAWLCHFRQRLPVRQPQELRGLCPSRPQDLISPSILQSF